MTLLSTRDETKRQAQLTRDDWIEAALDALVDEGVEAIQITSLSRKLNVTRGSFYWHFNSREELLDSLLKEWHARNTGVMLTALEGAKSLEDGILELFSVWVDHNRFDPKLDQAVRDWARRSGAIRDSVVREDTARVYAIDRFFRQLGYQGTEAFIRARVLYFTQVSYYALGVEEPMTQRMSYLEAYFRSFTGRDIDPARAAEFRDRLIRAEENK